MLCMKNELMIFIWTIEVFVLVRNVVIFFCEINVWSTREINKRDRFYINRNLYFFTSKKRKMCRYFELKI